MFSKEIQDGPGDTTAGGHQNGSGPEARPAGQSDNVSDEKKLRALIREKSIDSTTSLVRAYNGSATGETEQLLHKFLCIYSAKKEQYINPNTVMEYAELCKITPRTDDDRELLHELVSALAGRIPDGEFAVESVAEALYRSLLWTPPAIIQEDLTGLTAMADKLTASLHPTPRLTEANFPSHEATFMALHEVFVLMQRTAREKVTAEEKKRFQSSLRAKRSSMGDSCKRYPVQYYFRLIEQSIQRLELDAEPSPILKAIHCLYIITCGFLHISHAVKQIAKLDIDPSQLKALPGNLKELVADIDVAESQWYDLLQALSVAGRECVRDHQKLEIFENSYKTVEESILKMRRRNEDGKALLFGLMQELRHLALVQGSSEVRTSGSSKLFALAETVSNSVWVKDKDIVEALLRCLHAVRSRGNDAEAALRSSQRLIDSVKSKAVSKAVREWTGDKSLEEKLGEAVHSPPEPNGQLFHAMGQEIDLVPLEEVSSNIEYLRILYRSKRFATVRLHSQLFLDTEGLVSKVSSLFDEDVCEHVNSMKRHIVICQTVEENHSVVSEQRDSQQREDGPPAEGIVKMPIALEDLFKPKPPKKDAPLQDIRQILFHGKPGSGKTCVGKAVAHMWATGQAWPEVGAVYVLPARELNDLGLNRDEDRSLVVSIVKHCFTVERVSDRGLRAQVDDQLDLDTTLLVIDGLDEANKTANEMLTSARRRRCRVLWLTRPYNLRSMREFADIEVECLGFSDEQVETYVEKEVPLDSGRELFDVLKSNASLWEVAHVPVMAHILSFLWKEGVVNFGGGRRLCPASMYADMVNYIWRRFLKKAGEEKATRKEVFATLEAIAFDALREDRILISMSFVERREASLNVKEVLRHSGFLLFKAEGLDYQFPHLTFQEYFAARWLAHSLNKATESDEHRKALDFLREEKYLDRHRTTLMFLAQQLAVQQGVAGLPELLSSLDEEPIEVVGLQHLLLKLRVAESWLTALDDSNIDAFCHCDAVVQLIDVSISVPRLPDKLLVRREFGDLFRHVILQCPTLFATVPKILDHLTKETIVRYTVQYGVFREVVRAAKHSPGHLKILVEEARRNILSAVKLDRYIGMDMLRELLDCAPQLSADLLSLCEMVLLNKIFSGPGTSLQAVISVLTDTKNIPSGLLSLLERTSANPNKSARKAVMEAIGSFASAASEHYSRILSLIKRACEDEDVDVCQEALRVIRHFVSEQEFLLADLIPVVERLTRDENEEIRREAIKTVECMGRKSSQVWSLLPPLCHSMCSAEKASVRRDAVEMAGRLAAYIPPLRGDLVPLIEAGCADECAVVRAAGMWAIKLLAARSSENSDHLLRTAAAGYVDENASVRRAAMEAISRLVSASHLSEDILSLVQRGCLDGDVHVRLWAVDALGRLSSAAPHLSEGILVLLRESCSDENVHVRQWSMEAIGNLASAVPDLAVDILPLLRVGCSDGEEHVRLWALKAISQLAAAAPHLSESLLPPLRNVNAGEDAHMMKRADEAMRAISSATSLRLFPRLLGASETERATDRPMGSGAGASNKTALAFEDVLREAIETMWPTKSHQFASWFLYEAVTVEKTKKSGYGRVVLHSTDKRVVGEYPMEHLKQFLSAVAETLDIFYDGLSIPLRKITTKKCEKDRQIQ